MTFTITKVYKERLPALRLIGKRYTDPDRGADGGFKNQWDEWFANEWFEPLEKLGPHEASWLGLMTCNDAIGSFAYWIGLFFPPGTEVPEGYAYLDLPESDVGIGWITGSEENGEIFGEKPHTAVCKALQAADMGEIRNDLNGGGDYCFFERYNCPRFTAKDAEGNVTLDYGIYLR